MKLKCTYCGAKRWERGPQGGLSTNIMCLGCGHWFNYHGGIIPMDDLHRFSPIPRRQSWWSRLFRRMTSA